MRNFEPFQPKYIKKDVLEYRLLRCTGEIEELRRKDEEEYHQQQLRTKENIQKHINLHGGDLSLLLSHPVPAQIKCVQLANFGTSKNIHTVRCPLPLPVKQEVLIRTFSWYSFSFCFVIHIQ